MKWHDIFKFINPKHKSKDSFGVQEGAQWIIGM